MRTPTTNAAAAELEKILASLKPSLEERAPIPLQQISSHLKRLRERHWRIAVAGAQGVGKSSLVRALLATKEDPEPPVPVNPREETALPVLYRRAERAGYREIYGAKRVFTPGMLDEAGVRARASADRSVFDSMRFRNLDALELELPSVALEMGVDLVDLPGVGGNLATVSKWAVRNLLERGSQCVVFVVSGPGTIECSAQEANLIRAFGPLMVRAVFVQNTWSGHDDDEDETARLNIEFLQEHVGEDAACRYIRLDVRAALTAARRGERALLEPVLSTLAPFFRRDHDQLARDEAERLRNVLFEVNRVAMIDRLDAIGRADTARKARGAVAAERERESSMLDELSRAITAEIETSKTTAREAVGKHVAAFGTALDEFIANEAELRQDPFEREVARRVGQLQRGVAEFFAEEGTALGARIEARSREILAGIEIPALGDVETRIDAPDLEYTLHRKLVQGMKWAIGGAVGVAAGLGGAAAGLELGAMLGAAGGPPGAIIGGILGTLIGAAAGTFASSQVDERFGSAVSAKERAHVRSELAPRLVAAETELRASVHSALDKIGEQVTQRIATFGADRRGVVMSREREVAATGAELEKMERDEAIVRRALTDLSQLIDRPEGA